LTCSKLSASRFDLTAASGKELVVTARHPAKPSRTSGAASPYLSGFGQGGVVFGPSFGGSSTVNVLTTVPVCVPFAS
jgi:hypothetical protein